MPKGVGKTEPCFILEDAYAEVKGKYNTAKVFTDVVDEKSLQQIKTLCDQEFTSGARIRLMPDVHAGAGCTIGTTMTIKDKIVPNLVGVDIGCGMETLMIHKDSEAAQKFDPAQLDMIIRKNIPCGFDIRKFEHQYVAEVEWDNIKGIYNKHRAQLSLGTLGGGNHFIEADKDEGETYILLYIQEADMPDLKLLSIIRKWPGDN